MKQIFHRYWQACRTKLQTYLGRSSLLPTAAPTTIGDLQTFLKIACEKGIVERDIWRMLEGTLDLAKWQVRDIMVPASHAVVLKSHMAAHELLHLIIESGHSRFPVIGEDRDDVLGVFLAKDLLPFLNDALQAATANPQAEHSAIFDIRLHVRKALRIPESKRLGALLTEFRMRRTHMALVIDEYGGFSGIVTLEDVLEEIVGDISDEYDKGPDSPFVRRKNPQTCIVEALMPIDAFNTHFQTHIPDTQFDTIGGWVLHHFGRVPARGDKIRLNGWYFKVLNADNRRIRTLEVYPDPSSGNLTP